MDEKKPMFDSQTLILTCISSFTFYDLEHNLITVTDTFVDMNGEEWKKTDYMPIPVAQKEKLSVELPKSIVDKKFYHPKQK